MKIEALVTALKALYCIEWCVVLKLFCKHATTLAQAEQMQLLEISESFGKKKQNKAYLCTEY